MEHVKSIFRHLLTATGTILIFTGLNEYQEAVEYAKENADTVIDSVQVIVGFVTTMIGFFANRNRHADRLVGSKLYTTNAAEYTRIQSV